MIFKTALQHAMINSDALSAEFCEVIGLSNIFGDLVNCGLFSGSVSGDGLSVVLTADSCVQFGACGLPHGMEVTVNGAPVVIGGAVITNAGLTLTITVSPAIVQDDVVVWTYTAGASCIVHCETLADIGTQSVVVANPIETTNPELIYQEVGIQGSNIFHLTFDEDVVASAGDYAAGWSITADAVPLTISVGTHPATNTIYLTTDEDVVTEQTVLISYTSVTGEIVDVSGFPDPNPLLAFSDRAVINNVSDDIAPLIQAFVANGGSDTSESLTISVDTLDATDNISIASDMSYQVNTIPASPPPPSSPAWVAFADRLDSITVPEDGVYTFTGYARDEAGNVSAGTGVAQQQITVATAQLDPTFGDHGTYVRTGDASQISMASTLTDIATGDLVLALVQRNGASPLTVTCDGNAMELVKQILGAELGMTSYAWIATEDIPSAQVVATFEESLQYGSMVSARWTNVGNATPLQSSCNVPACSLRSTSANRWASEIVTTERTLLIGVGTSWNDFWAYTPANGYSRRFDNEVAGVPQGSTQFIFDKVADSGTHGGTSDFFGSASPGSDEFYTHLLAFEIA